jgi:hypothetical protein
MTTSYTAQELNKFTRDELRRFVRDNKIDCVPTQMNKEELIKTLLTCQEGKLKCPKTPYAEFKGKAKDCKSKNISIPLKSPKTSPKKQKKKAKVSSSESESESEEDKESVVKYTEDQLDPRIKKIVLSFLDKDTSPKMSDLQKGLGFDDETFKENYDLIKKLGKIYGKELVDMREEKRRKEEESEEESEEEESEQEKEFEDNLEKAIKEIVLSFVDKTTKPTTGDLKRGLKDKLDFDEDKFSKYRELIVKLGKKYGSQLVELRKSAKKVPPSPKRDDMVMVKKLKEKLSKRVSPVRLVEEVVEEEDEVSPKRDPSPKRAVSPVRILVEEVVEEEDEVSPKRDPSPKRAVSPVKRAVSPLEEDEESDVESLADEEELFKERKQYLKYSKISSALNECIMQTLLKI